MRTGNCFRGEETWPFATPYDPPHTTCNSEAPMPQPARDSGDRPAVRRALIPGLTLALAFVALPLVLVAQPPQEGQMQSQWEVATAEAGPGDEAGPDDPDFFFGRPFWTVSLRAGAYLPRASGQFYDFAFERFTLNRGDFRSFAGGADVGLWVNDHLELQASVDVASSTQRSEYLDWWEETPQGDSLGIEQSTRLTYGPAVTVGARVFPTGRGEHLSRFVWVPNQVAPYLSAGVGVMGYELEQWGDWVVETGPDEGLIFTEEFDTSDANVVTYLGAGVDYMLRPRIALNLDARYTWGEDKMGGDFSDFDRPLDLSGLRLTAGLSYRF